MIHWRNTLANIFSWTVKTLLSVCFRVGRPAWQKLVFAAVCALPLGCTLPPDTASQSSLQQAPLAPGLPAPQKLNAVTPLSAPGRATLTGVRQTKGNAVDCPTLMTDDGGLHAVKGLTSDIALGQRIRITGHYGVSTSCLGRVFIIEELTKL